MAVINGTTYPDDTPKELVSLFEARYAYSHLRQGRPLRLHIHYGDPETGQDWLELYETEGYLGRTCGSMKVPLLVNNTRSMGGSPISLKCVLRVRETGGAWRELYRHPNYKTPVLDVRKGIDPDRPWEVVHENGEVHSRWKTQASAWLAHRRLGAVTPAQMADLAAKQLLGAAA